MKFLRNRIVVYVPSKVSRIVKKYTAELADAAGGATTVVGWGRWQDVEEEVQILTVFYEADSRPSVQNALDNLLAAMGRAGELEVLVDYTPAQAVLV